MSLARLSYTSINEWTAAISLSGDLDGASALAFERAAAAGASNGKHDLLVDLTGVRTADASLVGSLLHIAQTLERLGGTLVAVAAVGSEIREALHMAELEARIPIVETQGEGSG